jgi:hypothetical protein
MGSFGIEQIIERGGFKNPVVRSFFEKWCEINDDVRIVFENREIWEKKILEKLKRGS